MSFLEIYDTLAEATKRCVSLTVDLSSSLENNQVHVIQDLRSGKFYVEDGCPLLRNFEEIIFTGKQNK